MSTPCNAHIREALRLAKELMALADRGDLDGQDDGCGVLYGVLRDCAWKIRLQAEREREAHQATGSWDPAGSASRDAARETTGGLEGRSDGTKKV